jgi:hypothetical protein
VKTLTVEKEALLKDKENLLREKDLAEKSKKQLELELQTEKGKHANYCREYLQCFLGSQAFNFAASTYMSNVVQHVVFLTVTALSRYYPFVP